jgi:hypothetical protein
MDLQAFCSRSCTEGTGRALRAGRWCLGSRGFALDAVRSGAISAVAIAGGKQRGPGSSDAAARSVQVRRVRPARQGRPFCSGHFAATIRREQTTRTSDAMQRDSIATCGRLSSHLPTFCKASGMPDADLQSALDRDGHHHIPLSALRSPSLLPPLPRHHPLIPLRSARTDALECDRLLPLRPRSSGYLRPPPTHASDRPLLQDACGGALCPSEKGAAANFDAANKPGAGLLCPFSDPFPPLHQLCTSHISPTLEPTERW